MQLIKPDINIDFMGKRNLLMMLSAALLVLSLIPLLIQGGPNYGIDFSGGILVQVKFQKPTDAAAVKEALKPIGLDDSTVQRFGKVEDAEFLIRAQKPDLELAGLDHKLADALKTTYGEAFEVRRVETVGPKVGKDLRQQALMAVFFALLLMAVYISGRFEAKWILSAVMAGVLVATALLAHWLLATVLGLSDTLVMVAQIIVALGVTMTACWLLRLRYAMGAVVSLSHDVLITVGIYTLCGKEFNLSSVAAILTVIGYSLNDTIIVYDRIRENLRKGSRGTSFEQVINDSVNQTLSRTILTSGTTILVLVCLFLLGGGVIEDFALALLLGVGVGTYSSVYVASPMLLMMPQGGGFKVSLPQAAPAKPAPRPAPKPAPGPEPEEMSDDPDRPATIRRVRGRTAKVSRAKRKKR